MCRFRLLETEKDFLTWTKASFIAAQLETLQAHSSTKYGFEWPLDWPYSVSGSHWFSSLEQLEMRPKGDQKVIKYWVDVAFKSWISGSHNILHGQIYKHQMYQTQMNDIWTLSGQWCRLNKNITISISKILPYPVVLPQLVLRKSCWGDIAPLMLFPGLFHCFLITFLGLKIHVAVCHEQGLRRMTIFWFTATVKYGEGI